MFHCISSISRLPPYYHVLYFGECQGQSKYKGTGKNVPGLIRQFLGGLMILQKSLFVVLHFPEM